MKQHVENLILFEIKNGIITSRDYVYVKNQLYHLLNLTVTPETIAPEPITLPSDALEPILDELERLNVLDGSVVARDLFDAKIMNVFASIPSVVQNHFDHLYQHSSTKATNWFYNYAKNLNYIRYDRILKNVSYETHTKYGNLQITINLSKPEKDPKSIALAGKTTSTQYPKCLLCVENEGFSGNYQRDSRDQHRLIELDLNQEKWYFQYSPYIYYPEHAIVLSQTHRPMVINETTFRNLLDLVSKFDGYFFGSNADLPIVGGSILSHDHYQGGKHHFPIEDAKTSRSWNLNDVTIESLIWPLSTIRLKSKHKASLVTLATSILNIWRHYNNFDLEIHAFTGDIPHQTITPIARFKNGLFELDLVLRNNRTTDTYPLGIYHPHSDKWHIKKENIGLIEAIGLAILPARLIQEKNYLFDSFKHQTPLHQDALKHETWFRKLVDTYSLTPQNFDQILNQEIGLVFEKVLEDCGVFKSNQIAQFNQFIEEEIYERLSK